jgi:copper chaperone CopZ
MDARGGRVPEFVIHIPDMHSRECVRRISGHVTDVPGVRTLRPDLSTRTLRIAGTATPTAVTDALHRAGYRAEIDERHAG